MKAITQKMDVLNPALWGCLKGPTVGDIGNRCKPEASSYLSELP